MNLKKLRIKNFKSHEDSTLEFESINTILGSNHSGKTNILRALKLILYHEDWPVTWIRYGQSEAFIEIELANKTVIRRTRTKSTQSVTISDGKNVTSFDGKKGALEFISKVIGIKKITLDDASDPEDLNFMYVHDSPFIIGGRPDTVQRKISGIIGANAIDDARVRLNKELKKKVTIQSQLSLEVSNLEEKVSASKKILEPALIIYENINSLDILRKNLEQNLQQLQELQEQIILFKQEEIPNISLDSIREKSNKLSNMANSLSEIVSIFTLYLSLNDDIVNLNTQIVNNTSHLIETKQAKDELLKKTGICPLCNNSYA